LAREYGRLNRLCRRFPAMRRYDWWATFGDRPNGVASARTWTWKSNPWTIDVIADAPGSPNSSTIRSYDICSMRCNWDRVIVSKYW
jgi:hypothetical protein